MEEPLELCTGTDDMKKPTASYPLNIISTAALLRVNSPLHNTLVN
jgi:hypothetical protein